MKDREMVQDSNNDIRLVSTASLEAAEAGLQIIQSPVFPSPRSQVVVAGDMLKVDIATGTK